MSLVAIILLIIAFLGFGSVSSTQVVSEPAATVVVIESGPWELVEIDDIQGVIVAPESISGMGLSEPYWAPTEADVIDAEQAIAEAEGDLEHYRQYLGFTENGAQKILVNGFCHEEPNWTSEFVFVLDGGECYFTATYNVDTQVLEDFMYNGDA